MRRGMSAGGAGLKLETVSLLALVSFEGSGGGMAPGGGVNPSSMTTPSDDCHGTR